MKGIRAAVLALVVGLSNPRSPSIVHRSSSELAESDETKPIFSAPILFVSFVHSWRQCRFPGLKRLVDNQPYTTGIYSLGWDGTDNAGKRLAPSIYL